MRVRIPTDLYTYPDVSIVCGSPRFEGDQEDILLNPLVLFEVLSPSTEAYDRGRTFIHYQTVPSLKEYVLVAQDRPRIDHFARQGDGRWLLTVVESGELVLPALGISLPLNEIYAKATFLETPPGLLDEVNFVGERPGGSGPS